MRTFVIGDIHGQGTKLYNLLINIKFDFENDKLICLGDYGDGRSDAKKSHNLLIVIQTLNKCKNKILHLGNHDVWCRDFLNKTIDKSQMAWWLQNGGSVTYDELEKYDEQTIQYIKDFYNNLQLITETDKFIFVHAGINMHKSISEQDEEICTWDRELVKIAMMGVNLNDDLNGKTIIVGHTCTQWLNNGDKPIFTDNLIALDTGAGHGNKLTVLNLETMEYFQI